MDVVNRMEADDDVDGGDSRNDNTTEGDLYDGKILLNMKIYSQNFLVRIMNCRFP